MISLNTIVLVDVCKIFLHIATFLATSCLYIFSLLDWSNVMHADSYRQHSQSANARYITAVHNSVFAKFFTTSYLSPKYL